MTSIETRNVRFFTFAFSIKYIKSVVSSVYDFCDFDIGCSNIHVLVSTKRKFFPLDQLMSQNLIWLLPKKKYKILFFLKASIDNVGPCRWSVNSFAVVSR